MSAVSSAIDGASATAGAPSLELSGVGQSFGQVKALTRVDLAALPGEIHAIVGDNGAGVSRRP